MKKNKKASLILIVILIVGIIPFIPYYSTEYNDGGSKEIVALAYKIIDWACFSPYDMKTTTKIYFGINRRKSIDDLWALEYAKIEKEENEKYQTFIATILEVNETSVLVEPINSNEIGYDKITFNAPDLADLYPYVSDVIRIFYNGKIKESYPAKINVKKWKEIWYLRDLEYTSQWIDKDTANALESFTEDIVITKIYKNCFFGTPVSTLPGEYKINSALSEEWCVGDKVSCVLNNVYYDDQSDRYETDLLTIEPSTLTLDPGIDYKPVIYLYPETKTDISIDLTLDGEFTCTYPKYNDGWTVTAYPDGSLTDSEGQTYNYLYWEGTTYAKYDLSKGFCVSGKNTAAFLEDALAKLGLNRREANEFIVYWLPLMEQNKYNIISFQTDIYTDAAQLNIEPSPDTLIRVFMAWQKSDEYVDIPEQNLTAPERTGFTVVEWGGTEIKK